MGANRTELRIPSDWFGRQLAPVTLGLFDEAGHAGASWRLNKAPEHFQQGPGAPSQHGRDSASTHRKGHQLPRRPASLVYVLEKRHILSSLHRRVRSKGAARVV